MFILIIRISHFGSEMVKNCCMKKKKKYFRSFRTILLYIVGELTGGGSVAVANGGRHMTSDTPHVFGNWKWRILYSYEIFHDCYLPFGFGSKYVILYKTLLTWHSDKLSWTFEGVHNIYVQIYFKIIVLLNIQLTILIFFFLVLVK